MQPGRRAKGRRLSARTAGSDGSQNDDESSPFPRGIPTEGSATAESDDLSAPKKAKRAALTRSACIRCRLAKAKCNGIHPACARCIQSDANCVYDVMQEGVTRMQNLQQKLQLKTRELEQVMVLVQQLRGGSDNDAAAVLAHLRLGDSIEHIVETVTAKPASLQREDSGGPSLDSQDTAYSADYPRSWPSTPSLSNPAPVIYSLQTTPGSSCIPDPLQFGAGQIQTGPLGTAAAPLPPPRMSTSPTSPTAFEDDSVYRQLPQISFGGAFWPAIANNAAYGRPTQSPSTQRQQANSLGMCPPPRRTPTLHYEGFLWPCGSGDGMPGVAATRRNSDTELLERARGNGFRHHMPDVGD